MLKSLFFSVSFILYYRPVRSRFLTTTFRFHFSISTVLHNSFHSDITVRFDINLYTWAFKMLSSAIFCLHIERWTAFRFTFGKLELHSIRSIRVSIFRARVLNFSCASSTARFYARALHLSIKPFMDGIYILIRPTSTEIDFVGISVIRDITSNFCIQPLYYNVHEITHKFLVFRRRST